jgi:hypothetical protein
VSDAPRPPPAYPAPSSPKGLLIVLGLLIFVGIVAAALLGDAWMWFFPRE